MVAHLTWSNLPVSCLLVWCRSSSDRVPFLDFEHLLRLGAR